MNRYVKNNLLVCILASIFLVGMLSGVLLLHIANKELIDTLHMLLYGYIGQRSVQPFSILATSSFTVMALLLLLLFFCGFCTISQPIIILLLLFRGMGYGFSLGGLYIEKGMIGVQYSFILLFIPLVLGALLLICAARNSFLLSVRLLKRSINLSEEDERYRMRRYCIRYFLYLILGVLIALLDAALASRFAGTFTF